MTLPLAFPANVRDVGGLPLTGGGVVRSGVLFRSDDPGRGDQVSGDRLTRELGVRHVVDLRHGEELERTGTLGSFVVRPDVVRHHVPLTLYDALAGDPLPVDAAGLAELYARSVVVSTPAYVRALRTLAEVDGPALVHCSHGKDRTGIVVALVLTALGADRAAIVEDFALTNDNLPVMHRLSESIGISIGMSRIHGILREAPPEAMAGFLELMDRDHGGPLGPLRAAGLDDDTVALLRTRLVHSSAIAPEGAEK